LVLFTQVEAQLAQLERRPGAVADVVIVGAGYAGIELATSVADRMRGAARIQVISSGAAPNRCQRLLNPSKWDLGPGGH
jgi:NADH dehydrogenase FAD-containing subunit